MNLKTTAASICLVFLAACAPLEEPVYVPGEDITAATRTFGGPGDFPPRDYGAWGIVAFPSDPDANDATRARFDRFCQAFSNGIVASDVATEAGIPIDQQMVTVMPLSSSDAVDDALSANQDDACAIARKNYDLFVAQRAIREANLASSRTDGLSEVSGRGPFLIAWSPGHRKGARDTIVLVSDLSNSESDAQMAQDVRLWVDTIQSDPSLWEDGWNLEALRIAGQRWIDRRAAAVLKLVGELQ